METLKKIALFLLIIGGLNWGLIGLFQFDLVASLFGGQDALLSRIIYALVGLSALICIPALFDSDDARTAVNRPNYGTEFGNEDDFDTRSDRDR